MHMGNWVMLPTGTESGTGHLADCICAVEWHAKHFAGEMHKLTPTIY